VNEISFNSSLMREMRAVAFVTKLIDDGKLSQGFLEYGRRSYAGLRAHLERCGEGRILATTACQ